MRNKIVGLIGIAVLLFLVWYLFLRPYDYLVSITAKTIPGVVNQNIKLWGKTNNNTVFIRQKDFFNIDQQLRFNDSIFQYQWKITSVSDSTTSIRVYIKGLNQGLWNRLKIPFFDTDFEKRTKSTIFDFNNVLTEHLQKFKVTVLDSIQQLPDTYCAYVPIKTSQLGKAKGMMQNYPILSRVLADNNVILNGKPFLEITNWNREVDSVCYNFCYPIIKSDSLPQNGIIKYKKFDGFRALKAIYNGNYITSDRAWYALLDSAKRNGLEVWEKPVEVFFSNPNLGGNELDWIAEIYLPLKE
ncbi:MULTISPECIES: AraC family transcriptional regulator [unclassified Arenibacter]|uniref:AraC family transcriptional regulator n=1 Tax=unclassified Arenibacter TaxID=2615047 RepID=UPI000E3482D6|nr:MULTISPECIES: AraC family transcriptional regulator [unclassified Arenibacter]MCM4163760.1 transcriptional regulator [Arenibacter sp. A80]RFT56479.1 AraC family transcriptional regulator [Arenibacter sp. P308M17]